MGNGNHQDFKIIPPDFVVIPYQLITDKKLQPVDRYVYGIIYWFEHLKDGRCTASNETMAVLLGVKSSSVRDSLTNLEKRGYIKRFYFDEKSHHRKEVKALVAYKKVRTLSPDT